MNPAIFTQRRAILEDTRYWYEEDPTRRAKSPSGLCTYLSPEGRRCALGRLLPTDLCRKFVGAGDVRDIFPRLPPEIQALGEDFLIGLQQLHDREDFWDSKGLRRLGLDHYETMLEVFC